MNDRDLPDHLTRSLPPPVAHFGDPTSRELARLIHLHPHLAERYAAIDLRRIGHDGRAEMLATIKAELRAVGDSPLRDILMASWLRNESGYRWLKDH